MELINPLADQYSKAHTSSLHEVCAQNESDTMLVHPHAHMHSGQVQGKLLEMLSRMVNPSNILEIGTFTGFSAMCLAAGLKQDGKLYTIEIRQEDADTASRYFQLAGLQQQIEILVGDAKEIIPTLSATWDMVFIDADKVNYIDYYELTLPMVRPGGWIIADNVLFHGQVLETPVKGKNAKAMEAFNKHVLDDVRVEQVMLTVRDGLSIIRKL